MSSQSVAGHPSLADTQVWLSPLAAKLPTTPESLLHWLDPRERERFQRFGNAGAAHRFLLGRLMLRSVLAKAAGVAPADLRIRYSANGKPFLGDLPNIHFSISHAAEAVAVALAPSPIGLDLEATDRRSQPWRRPEAFLHPSEAQRLVAMESVVEQRLWFARCWTCQEAAIKLLDGTLFDRAGRVQLSVDGGSGRCGEHSLRFSTWYPDVHQGDAVPAHGMADSVPSHMVSLAALQPVDQVTFRPWTGAYLNRG